MSNPLYYPVGRGSNSSRPGILHVSPLPPPWGGVAANLTYLLKSKLSRTFDMAVLDLSRSGFREDVSPTKHIWHFERIGRAVSFVLRIWSAISRFKPEIVHIQAGGSDASAIRVLFLAKIALSMGRKVLFHQHFWTTRERFRNYRAFFVPVYRAIAPRCATLIMLTPLHIEQASELIPVGNVVCLPNTCDPSLGEVGRTRRGGSVTPITVISIGRLSELKGTFDLLAAAERLKGQRHLVRFEIAGQGATLEDEQRVVRLIQSRGLSDTVALLGRVSGEKKIDLFRRADLLVHPSLSEALPVTLIEAMASGLPIIVSDVDGPREIIADGLNGLLFRAGDERDLAEKIGLILENRTLAMRLGMRARSDIKDYSIQAMYDRYVEVYTGLLDKGGGDRRLRSGTFLRGFFAAAVRLFAPQVGKG